LFWYDCCFVGFLLFWYDCCFVVFFCSFVMIVVLLLFSYDRCLLFHYDGYYIFWMVVIVNILF
jgi:hypothetical protein